MPGLVFTFGVTLDVPWNAPEAYIQLDSVGLFDLVTLPDVLGLTSRLLNPAVVRVTQGCDERSVSALVPDPRIIDSGFHDVTIVDMEDTPEPAVSESDLTLLRLQWPRSVLKGMRWQQDYLDEMRLAAKKRYRHTRAGVCAYCGKWIKCGMYCHVSTYHLDLGQLWHCPVSWYTVWKGTPQDCNDHIRGAHDIPLEFKTASLAKYFPPWTVQRQIWADALLPCHSGVSTDVLLFSEMQLALVYHYRVFRKGLPHLAFRRNYLDRLRGLVSQSSALDQDMTLSPAPPGPGSPRNALPVMRRPGLPARHVTCITGYIPLASRTSPLLCPSPVMVVNQDVQDFTGYVVYDCRPRILPVLIRLDGLRGPSVIRWTPSSRLAAPPVEAAPVSRFEHCSESLM